VSFSGRELVSLTLGRCTRRASKKERRIFIPKSVKAMQDTGKQRPRDESMNDSLRHRRLAMLALAFSAGLAVACGSSASNGTSGSTSGDAGTSDTGTGTEASPNDAATADVATPPAGSGTGTVTGSVGGTPFGSVATALWAGAPDDPATTVVYVFSKPVACSELATPGWDTRITNGTSVLEMKSFGTMPASYTVVTTLTPAPGEASVNYTLSSTTGTPKEDGSTMGTVTLTTLTPNVSAKGSFTLTFGTSSLSGSFDAVFCPGGHEP
jgi:hypothetical protein